MLTSASPIKAVLGFLFGLFLGLLFVKLVGWPPVGPLSWWLVTAPLWGPWALAIAGVLLLIGLGVLKILYRATFKTSRR